VAKIVRTFASAVMVLALTTTPQIGYADSTPPTMIGPRYFVGDPLYGFQGPNGELFSGLPDDPSPMASTTKIVSLHVAVDALLGRIPGACPTSPAGFCTLGDWVTISANAVAKSPWVPCASLMGGGCSSLMGDIGEFLVLDSDQDGVYDASEAILRPSNYGAPAAGTALADDPQVTYVDSNGNGSRDAGEYIVWDANSNGQFDLGELLFLGVGSAPTATTTLADDARIRYVDIYELGTWNSYIPLQVGEQVQFADLLRGMMYPSGNDAAIAIAEHVAGDVRTFVERMNDGTAAGHVTAAGLPNSHFTNPAGIDNFCPDVDAYGAELHLDQTFCNDSYQKNGFIHYTTARDLAQIWEHGFQDLLFRQIVGFPGPSYDFVTYLGATQKQYRLGWGTSGYPGLEGGKGGSSAGCGSGTTPGFNLNCSVLSTKRIGRRLVSGFLAANYGPPNDDPVLALDYSYAQLFHPDLRDSVGSGVGWIDHALACVPDGGAVTAAMAPDYGVKLTTWGVDVDDSAITKIAESAPQGASQAPLPLIADLQAIRLESGSIITAKTLGIPSVMAAAEGGSVKLSLWNITQGGAPSLVIDEVPAGAGTGLNLLPIADNLFASALIGQDGTLVLKSWRVATVEQGGPTPGDAKKVTKIMNLGTLNPGLAVDRVSIAGPFVVGALYYFVTAVRHITTNTVRNQLWSLDPVSGAIASVAQFSPGIQASDLRISAVKVEPRLPDDEIFAPIYFATALRTPGGFLRIFYAGVDFDFDGFKAFSERADTGVTTDVILERPSVVPFGTSGVVTAVKDGAAKQKLIVWESRRNLDDTITPYRIAEHEVPTFESTSIAACAISTTHAEGDVVSSNLAVVGGLQGALQLRAWRIGDRP